MENALILAVRPIGMIKTTDDFWDCANVPKHCRIRSALKTSELNNIQFCSTYCPTANSFPLLTDHHGGSSEAVHTFISRFQHLLAPLRNCLAIDCFGLSGKIIGLFKNDQLHKAQSLLKSWQFPIRSRNPYYSMESESSLPWSQQPVTWPYLQS